MVHQKEEKNNKGIDTRILRLGKWQIPRTESVNDIGIDKENNNENKEKHEYLSMGYFDLIEITEAKSDEHHDHAFRNGYKALIRQKWETWQQEKRDEHLLEEYTIHELILFTNCKEVKKLDDEVNPNNDEKPHERIGFTKDEIDSFWNNENMLLFVSLIHIDNEDDVGKIVARIRSTFGEKEESFLYYFSFDYSGIVLFAKCKSVATYLNLLFALNYKKSEEDKKLIRDSYSFYGFNKEKLKLYFKSFDNSYSENKAVDLDESDIFTAVVNIGVQNYQTYKKLIELLKKEGMNPQGNTFGMLGRHDISIVNNAATMKWLVHMQYFLDKLTREHKENTNQLFSTHETFIKISTTDDFADATNPEKDDFYLKIREKLESICEQYSTALKQAHIRYQEKYDQEPNNAYGQYRGQYHFPIQEIRYSILSVMKNRYAENFILCIYRPFVEFLRYLIGKLENLNEEENPGEFKMCFSEFFNCLSALVNSAMHSERQFIQATAFDAVLYDVPSKILAFYMALINKVKKVMAGDESYKYTFILTPSFSNDILVSIISYQEDCLPCDRILKVEINEKSLYNPPEMEWQIVHEVAHFMGGDLRKREIRKERIIFSVVLVILFKSFHGSLLKGHIQALEELTENIKNALIELETFSKNDKNHSSYLYSLGDDILEEFKRNEKVKSLLKAYLQCIWMENQKEQKAPQLLDYAEKLLGKNKIKMNNENLLKNPEPEIIIDIMLSDTEERMKYINKEEYTWFLNFGEKNQSVTDQEEGALDRYLLGQIVNVLISIYYEAYADLQEVLITGISYQEYLLNFLGDEDDLWKSGVKENMEDMGRISMVCMVMEKCGFWNYGREEVSEKKREELEKLHKEVQKIIKRVEKIGIEEDLKEIFGKFQQKHADYIQEMPNKKSEKIWSLDEKQLDENVSYLEARLCLEVLRYLYHCVDASVEKYSDNKKTIKDLRTTMDTVNECRDIQEVFTVMSIKTKEYKEEISKS